MDERSSSRRAWTVHLGAGSYRDKGNAMTPTEETNILSGSSQARAYLDQADAALHSNPDVALMAYLLALHRIESAVFALQQQSPDQTTPGGNGINLRV